VSILISFFSPERLLTDAAAGLVGKDRVEAENAVRSSIIQVGGSIIVIGMLGLAAWRLILTDRQLRSMEASAQAALDGARAARKLPVPLNLILSRSSTLLGRLHQFWQYRPPSQYRNGNPFAKSRTRKHWFLPAHSPL
jgi:hypothetical protein